MMLRLHFVYYGTVSVMWLFIVSAEATCCGLFEKLVRNSNEFCDSAIACVKYVSCLSSTCSMGGGLWRA